MKWEFSLDYHSGLNAIINGFIRESQGLQSQLRSCEDGSTGCSYTETRARDCGGYKERKGKESKHFILED